MKENFFLIPSSIYLILLFFCCKSNNINPISNSTNDSLILVNMVNERETAMKEKNIPTIMSQFSDDATFINSGGYYSADKKEIENFHSRLTHLDSINYHYKAGNIQVRILDNTNALVYYPWRMDWFHLSNPNDTINKEVGLMTLTAQKRNKKWLWIAITNQHTKEYFDNLYNHKK